MGDGWGQSGRVLSGSRIFDPFFLKNPRPAPDQDLGNPHRRHGIGHRDALIVFTAGAAGESQIVPDPIDVFYNLGTIANQGGVFDRFGDLAILDQMRLGAFKDKIAIDGIHLTTAHVIDKESPVDRLDDVSGIVCSRGEDRVGHADDGTVFV